MADVDVTLELKAQIRDLDKKLDAAEKELRQVEGAFEKATASSKQAATAADDYTDALQNASGKTGNFSQIIFSAGDAVQDFSFAGLRGAGNNLAFIAESFVQASDTAGGFKGAIGGVSSALLGPAGAVLAIQGLLVALPRVIDAFSDATVESEKFEKQLEKLEQTAGRLFNVTGQVAGVEIAPADFGEVARIADEEVAALGLTLQTAQDELTKAEARLAQLQQRYENSAPLSDYRAEVGRQIKAAEEQIQASTATIARLTEEQGEWQAIQKEVKAAREEFERALTIRQKLQAAAGDPTDLTRTRPIQTADVEAAEPAGQDLGTVNAQTVQLAGNFDQLARKAGFLRAQIQATAEQSTLSFQLGTRAAFTFGAGLGDVISRIVTLDASITSVQDAFSELGKVGQRVLQGLIRQFTAAAAKAAALRAVASIFGLGSIGGFGSLFKGALGLAGGGSVSGPGSSTSDSIPALLSDGEFVVNAASTSAAPQLVSAINASPQLAGQLQSAIGFSGGGLATLRSVISNPAPAVSLGQRSRSTTLKVEGGFDVTLDKLRYYLSENAALMGA